MAPWDPLSDRLRLFRNLTPGGLKRLARQRLSDVVLGELGRSRRRVAALEKRYPSAPPRELAQRLTDAKKGLASTVGGVTGVFGLVSLPADLLAMAWLQVSLLVDIATVYKANLKSASARGELLDVLGYANGIGPLQRAGPRMLGRVASALFEVTGWSTMGRAVPLVAAPLTAWLNHQHLQKVGEEAVRFYEGFEKAKGRRRMRT